MDRISTLYRKSKLDDIVSLVQTGKPVEALFAMKGTAWIHSFLHGILYKNGDFRWLDSRGADWDDCLIYDPPQWYLDKPDPGDGWRLLEKFPAEELQSGFDQVYHVECQSWLGVATISSEQTETDWYRRRIEPVKPDPGDGYRLLEKDPPEPLKIGDEVWMPCNDSQPWLASSRAKQGILTQDKHRWYRRPMVTVTPVDPFVSVLCEVKLPVSCKVLGAITESLSKEYPGATMRQVGEHLRFERRIDDWNEES